jgi:hypothetical protein
MMRAPAAAWRATAPLTLREAGCQRGQLPAVVASSKTCAGGASSRIAPAIRVITAPAAGA